MAKVKQVVVWVLVVLVLVALVLFLLSFLLVVVVRFSVFSLQKIVI
jgi:hypothetical protein